MKFLYPPFLFALFAVLIPVIIHLFSFRRYRTVYFSHVDFLKEIKKESRNRSRLKQLLMLIARILTIIFLVFAFAQPYFPLKEGVSAGTSQVVGIYIDNSFSMNALSAHGQLLEQARSKAVEIAQSYPPGTRFRLFTNDLEPQHRHLFNREQFILRAGAVRSSPVVVPLHQITSRFDLQSGELGEGVSKTLYLLSDFQRRITDPESLAESSVFSYLMPFVPNQTSNLYIDSCWVEVPAHGLNQEEVIYVRIKNQSPEDFQNLPLKLFLNDSLKSITNYSVEANREVVAELRYTNLSPGAQLGRIEITDYPFTHDNQWYLSYFVKSKLRVAALYDRNKSSQEGLAYLTALFRNDDYVELEAMDLQSLQVSRLANFNTLFLINPEHLTSGLLTSLEPLVQAGTSVVLFPSMASQTLSTNQFLTQFGASLVSGIDTARMEISGIDYDNRFFRNVFRERTDDVRLPVINAHLKYSDLVRSRDSQLLWFPNGDRALSVMPYGNGKVWNFSFSLDHQNESFARDMLFVPVIYNIVLHSLTGSRIDYTIGRDQVVMLPRQSEGTISQSAEVIEIETGERFMPGVTITPQGTRLDAGSAIQRAGHYLVNTNGEQIASLSYNYDRNESILNYYSLTELEEITRSALKGSASVIANVSDNFSEVFRDLNSGRQLWRFCIMLALFFILAEVLIARFWR